MSHIGAIHPGCNYREGVRQPPHQSRFSPNRDTSVAARAGGEPYFILKLHKQTFVSFQHKHPDNKLCHSGAVFYWC